MMTRDQRRSRRKRVVRSCTIAAPRHSRRRRATPAALRSDERRPKTRAGCVLIDRPCPFVSCKHHLYLDVNQHGGMKLNFPDLEPDELAESCSLDVADRGPQPFELIGDILNVTREAVRLIELRAKRRLGQSLERNR